MTILLNNTGNPINRIERIKINENWDKIVGGLTNLQFQINTLAGGQEIQGILDAINQAITDVADAQTKADEAIRLATEASDLANASASNATTKASEAEQAAIIANEATTNANEAIDRVNNALVDIEALKQTTIDATADAIIATGDANTATDNANQATQAAQQATTGANSAAGRANTAADAIEGWGQAAPYQSGTYSRNNVVTYEGSTYQSLADDNTTLPTDNTKWIVLARKGLDGQGAVQTVNNKMPDQDGDVEVGIADINGLQDSLNSKASNTNLTVLEEVVTTHLDNSESIAVKVDKASGDDTETLNEKANYINDRNTVILSTDAVDYKVNGDLTAFANPVVAVGKGNLVSSNPNNRYFDIFDQRSASGILTKLNPAYNLENINKFSNALVNAKSGGAKVKVTFVGDSLTQGQHRVGDGYWWTERLKDRLIEQFGDYFEFYNRGYAGRALSNLNDVLSEPVNAPGGDNWVTGVGKTWIQYVEDTNPDLVICAFGTNEAGANYYPVLKTGRTVIKGIASNPDIVWVTSPIQTLDTSAIHGGTNFGSYPNNEYGNNAGILTRKFAQVNGDAVIDVNRNASVAMLGLDPYQYRLDRWLGQYRDISDKVNYNDRLSGGDGNPVDMTINNDVTIETKRLFRNLSMEFTPTGTMGMLRIWCRLSSDRNIYTMIQIADNNIELYGMNKDTSNLGILSSWTGDAKNKRVRIEIVGVGVRVFIGNSKVIDYKSNVCSQFLSTIQFQALTGTNCVLSNIIINADHYKKFMPRISSNEAYNVFYGDGGNGLNHPNTLGELEFYEQPLDEFISDLVGISVANKFKVSTGEIPLEAGATGGLYYVKQGNLVTLHFNDIGGTFGDSALLSTLPIGLRPIFAVREAIVRTGSGEQDVMSYDIRNNGAIFVYNTPVPSVSYSGTVTYIVD